MSRWGRLVLLLAATIALVPAASAFAQCAMCRATLENSPETMAKSAEFNQAIMLMFVAPYLVASSLAFAIFRRQIVSAVRLRLAAPLASVRTALGSPVPR